MLKIYRIKQMSKSMFIYPNGVPTRIEFSGGTSSNKYHGQFSTKDEATQLAIEAHPDFGTINNAQIYLSDTLDEEGNAVWGIAEPKIEIKEEDPVIGFSEVKAILIEMGVPLDKLKNLPQVKKLVKEMNLPYTL